MDVAPCERIATVLDSRVHRCRTVRPRSLALPIISCLLALGACGGGSGSDDAPGAAAIAGLYDITKDFEDGVRDEIYLEIGIDGSIVVYDYLGDSFDVGPNCYFRFDEGARFLARGDDRYAIYDPDGDETMEPEENDTVRRTGDTLVITYVDKDDDDEDGNVDETLVDRVPVAQGIASQDFSICTMEEVSAAFDAGEPGQTFDDSAASSTPVSVAGKLRALMHRN